MERRSYMESLGVAAGVLATGPASASADTTDSDGNGTIEYDDGWSGPLVRTADDLAELSTDQLLELPNELVKRPFNPEIGGDAYDADEFEGADGYPHGGTVTDHDADYVVETADEMEAALGNASSGDVVWVASDAAIDATGRMFQVPGGVTVASDRGENGSSAGRLYKTEPTAPEYAIFETLGDGCRFTGLHLHGGEEGFWTLEDKGVDHVYDYGLSLGVLVRNDAHGTEIDNCLLHGFTYCGIRLGWFSDSPRQTYIHHNDIVDIPAPNLGYGITIWDADPLIEYNYFDATRHAVAGHGGSLMSHYVFRHNLCGPRTRLHVIDMHGGENTDVEMDCEIVDWLTQYVDNWVAGQGMTVENNVVLATVSMRPDSDYPQGGVVVRGVPADTVEVRNNWFFQPSPPFSDHSVNDEASQTGFDGDAVVQWYTNHYCNIETSNNITSGAHPTNDIGLEAQWQPDAGRSGSDGPDSSGSPPEGYGPQKGAVPDNTDPVREQKESQ
jgi:hypothetical protein